MATAAAASPAPPAPPPASGAALPVRNKGLLTFGVMLATIIQILDTTIANVALPHMQTALGATADTITWVLTSYIVASAIAIPITGWVSDRIGSRNLFLLSIIGFIVSSALCGMAQNLEEMVLFRVLQGVSAAFMNPLSQTVMLDINKPQDQPRAMAVWGMGIMIGPILGPVLGGWLTTELALHHIGWQALATLIFVWAGALDAWPGYAGLGVTAVSWAALLGHVQFSTRSAAVLESSAVLRPERIPPGRSVDVDSRISSVPSIVMVPKLRTGVMGLDRSEPNPAAVVSVVQKMAGDSSTKVRRNASTGARVRRRLR